MEKTKKWDGRKAYLIVLGVVVLGFVFARRGFIWPGNLSFLDQGLLVFTALLLVVPLFSEFEGFGFKLKKEIQEAKKELKEDIRDLRLTVQTSVGVHNAFTIHAASGKVLESIKEKAQEEIKELAKETRGGFDSAALSEKAEVKKESVPLSDVPLPVITPEQTSMLRLRNALEQQVKRIYQVFAPAPRKSGIPPFHVMVRELGFEDMITEGMAPALRQLYAITSRSIHGESLTNDQRKFVQDVGPEILRALRVIEG